MESFTQVVDYAKQYCKSKVSELVYTLWIEPLSDISLNGDVVIILIDTPFKRDILQNKYIDLFQAAFEQILGFPVKIEIKCSQTDTSHNNPDGLTEKKANFSAKTTDQEYTFDNFVVGTSNKFAHAASISVAERPAESYNPLFIYGGSGLGKTHLLYAIKNAIQQKNPKFNILYVKSEQFTNELIIAVREGSTREFHEKHRNVDVLLCDDIQFIGGKEATQEEFFHTFNTLFEKRKQIILTSDRPPKEIKTLEERLRARFEWGLLADVAQPDFETRIAICTRKAQLLGLDLPKDVTVYLAERVKSNVRQLEGALKRLHAYKLVSDAPTTISSAQKAINDILTEEKPVSTTVERIMTEVARTFEVSTDELISDSRASNVSGARQVAMYAIREILQLSTTTIGEHFGKRDHSTVVYATKQVRKNIQKDKTYKEMVEDIIRNIRGL